MHILIGIALFITVVLCIEGGYFAWRALLNPERRRLRRSLQTLASGAYRTPEINIVRNRLFSEIPWLHTLLATIPSTHDIARLLEQANIAYPPGVFLLLALLLAFVGFMLSSWVLHNALLGLLGAVGGGLMPFLYAKRQKQQRIQKFQRQLPEALDLLARALQAGHAFMVGMKMIGDEFADPIGPEFDKTIHEINFGGSAPEALEHLSRRIDCPDLRFFVTSVIVQRETGGDLAEIVGNISRLIRKRFELHGRIRILAAEGKISAIVLIVLPFLIGLAIFALNPEYLSLLVTDPLGPKMLGCAGLMMFVGVMVIKKMIKIRV